MNIGKEIHIQSLDIREHTMVNAVTAVSSVNNLTDVRTAVRVWMQTTVSNQELLDDFEYIREFEGVESDFCGAFCNCDTLMQILRGTATRREAILHYFEWIFSDRGAKIPSNDARCKEIAERYHISNEISWEV